MTPMRSLLCLSVVWLVAQVAVAAEPAAPLTVRVSVPALLKPKDARDVTVTLANESAKPVLVLPNLVRLRIEGAGAEYVAYPGPPVDPTEGARTLAPGATEKVVLRDTSDKRGVWRLPPGAYRVVALYEVPAELRLSTPGLDAASLWRGRLESAAVPFTVAAR